MDVFTVPWAEGLKIQRGDGSAVPNVHGREVSLAKKGKFESKTLRST